MTSILVLNPIAVMLSMAHSVAENLLLVGTQHAIGYLWRAVPNVMEISQVRGSEGVKNILNLFCCVHIFRAHNALAYVVSSLVFYPSYLFFLTFEPT